MKLWSRPGFERSHTVKERKWSFLLLAVCTGLTACQRPAQELPAAPVFTMAPAAPRPLPSPSPAPRPAALQFQPFAGPTVIFFEGDSAAVSDAARAILDQQADWLLRNPGVTAVMRGHADLLGSRARQFAIGEMRAVAMRRYLVARGVSPDRIKIASFGKQQPLSRKRDEDSQRRNRRGETIFGGLAGPSQK